MSSKKSRQIGSLLKRFEFTDFAGVVATPRSGRKDKLRSYLDRDTKGRWRSYEGFRSMVRDIVGVERTLDVSPPLDLRAIEAGLRRRCHPDDLGMNLDAARTLFDYVRPRGISAYDDHPRNPLYISHDRTISMRVDHYVVDGERGAFQFVYPRREPMQPDIRRIALSLIHHNFVHGDFEGFEVEAVELSCDQLSGPRGGLKLTTDRRPKTHRLPSEEIADRSWLNEQANDVYLLLMEIARDD